MRVRRGDFRIVLAYRLAWQMRQAGEEVISMRVAEAELGTDSPRLAFASNGQKRSSYEETDRHKQAEELLAIESAQTIQQIAAEEPGKIIVIADPRSLGTLRKDYDAAIRQRLEAEIDKDLTNLTADRIAESIVRYNERV